MKKDDHFVSQIKFQLNSTRCKKRGFVEAKPNFEERETLRDMGRKVEPHKYEITLKFPRGFRPGKNTAHIVKDLYYYMVKNHKSKCFRHLSPSQKKACRNFGLEVKPCSYKIY